MLQVIKRLLLFVFFLGVSVQAQQVDWLFEDALQNEIVPLVQTSVVLPADYQKAIELYKAGNYQVAIRVLENLRDLNLPDGRLDFVYFVLGESYRMLRLKELALSSYRSVVSEFSTSEKVAPSYFRILQYAYSDKDTLLSDTICTLFQRSFRNSPLFSSVLYVTARLRFGQSRYDEAITILLQIAPTSSQFQQAQLLLALCYLQKKEWEKALLILDYVRSNTKTSTMATEASLLIGDVYFNKGNYPAALQYYSGVSRSSNRYYYSLVKKARVYLEMKNYTSARDMALSFIKKNKTNEYFFEMVSVLELAYTKLSDPVNAERMKKMIYTQLENARLAFDIYEELGRVSDMTRIWLGLEFKAMQGKDDALLTYSKKEVTKLQALGDKYQGLLLDIGVLSEKKKGESIPGLAERRYIDILKLQADKIRDSVDQYEKHLDTLRVRIAKNSKDSVLAKSIKYAGIALDSVMMRYDNVLREKKLVEQECLGDVQGQRQTDENMQTKFVDWAFMKYQDKKIDLANLNKELITQQKAGEKKDTIPQKNKAQSKAVIKKVSAKDIEKMSQSIASDRSMISSHIASMQRVYPQSRFMPHLLFRLAELYFDQSSDDFEEKLRIYEKRMAEAKDSGKIGFPEFDLTNAIEKYDEIIKDFPHDEMADDACFYKALSLQKMGRLEEANAAMLTLNNKYPSSEYYVEANMNIARYYFEHPKIEGGKGYKLAEEAYQRVLYYRDHPQFVQALYSLGWCYYMQDRYDEAIAVFKYLVEEVALDFDVTKIDEKKQVTNPLLRDEAIDYIAISFDEESRTDDAVNFLQLIGNVDYAAMVLKRIAELRVEDMDYLAAVKVYKRLIAEYPQSIAAPDASIALIKVYEIMNQPDSAFKEREQFFTAYSNGSLWQNVVWKSDSLLIPRVDSMAISIGLYCADATFRFADIQKSPQGYDKAAGYYRAVAQKYPHDKRASDALWNLAVILETKVEKTNEAYAEYIKFSHYKDADLQRREQAALNAIAIAQKLLPPDTTFEEGRLDSASLKLVEAVKNYQELFPSGSKLGTVLLSVAALYFNRKMYANASEYFEQIVKKGVINEDYWEAMSLLGQCHFGKENWESASNAFVKVWNGSIDPVRRSKAYKLLLQSEFAHAKQQFEAGAFEKAGDLFQTIDAKYPGSEYGDIVLFKASESYEKKELWVKACECYYKLYKNYGASKLAPNALFNAASDYEKANKFEKAAETYEMLVAAYPQSDKSKDAMFNLGLCYEKVNKLDKMAEANERYTQLYPGEKDVEAMLLRSAQYYYKANMFDRAVNAYRSFIRRYPQSPKVIESLYMIGKMAYEKSDRDNAILSFSQAEQLNIRLAQANLERNDYFAAEAAYYLATMKRDDFLAVQFVQPDAKFKADQKLKSLLLAEASKAYEKVIQYQSEKMFEAAFRIGQMYEDLVETWKTQERPKLAPIPLAILEKDIAQTSSLLLQKSFGPYKKVLEIAAGFDSLKTDQKVWVQKAKVGLARNCFASGQFQVDAIAAMQNSPVPPEIKAKPLFYYQYVKQILETIDPMKIQVRNYYLSVSKQLDSLGLKGENSAKCLVAFNQMNFLGASDYDKLAEKILREPEIPATLSVAEREELSFQLEDVVFELQDKAIFAYEDALKLLKKENMASGEYYTKILFSLARLSPEKYGKSVYVRAVLPTSSKWYVRADSTNGWNGAENAIKGWSDASEISGSSAMFPQNSAPYIWHNDTVSKDMYAWQHVVLNGQPRDATVYIKASGKYWLYINGKLTSSDTTGKRNPDKLDSIAGITALVKGGDNDISLHVVNIDPAFKGCAVLLATLLDTTQHFKVAGKYPERQVAVQTTSSDNNAKQASGKVASANLSGSKTNVAAGSVVPELSFDKQYKNKGELLQAITDFQKFTEQKAVDIKKERIEIQKLMIKRTDMDEKIRKTKEETAELKKRLEGMGKGK